MTMEGGTGLAQPEQTDGDDPLLTAKIALAHLRELPDYYTRLASMESEGEEHLRAVVARLGGRRPAARAPKVVPAVSSLLTAVELYQEPRPLLVGERTNTNGSRKFKQLLEKEDWHGLVEMAQEQEREGVHVLDVCVDYVGHDGAVDMDEIASRFATQASVPLVFDSTESPVMEAGLQWFGGRAILNSANLEEARARAPASTG